MSAPFRHCEARSAVAIHVPEPMLQWIASFLAMTGRWRNVGPLRHCEARSAVAIHVPEPMLQWIASFLAMTGRGRNDGAGAQ
jgi:hypothetical protein